MWSILLQMMLFQVVIILKCVREVPSSDLGWATELYNRGLWHFLSASNQMTEYHFKLGHDHLTSSPAITVLQLFDDI